MAYPMALTAGGTTGRGPQLMDELRSARQTAAGKAGLLSCSVVVTGGRGGRENSPRPQWTETDAHRGSDIRVRVRGRNVPRRLR